MAVGVLIPVRGFAPYLAEAIDSVLAAQVHQVIVVDDGSDSPVTLGSEHAARVKLVRRATPGGPAVARATGLDALDTAVDLVALCDADDAWADGKMEAQLRALTAAPEAGWCFGRALVVGPDGRPTGERWAELQGGVQPAKSLGPELYRRNSVPTSSVVLRRDAVHRVGGFEAPVFVAEDWELWLRLCAAGLSAVVEPEAVVRYRRHPGGLTADVAALARAQLEVHERHAGLVGGDVAHAIEGVDRAALADGLARAGDYAGSRAEWARLARLRPLHRRERMRRAALSVPGLRARLGRADPYRG